MIFMAIAGCYVKVERDVEKAVRTLENVLIDIQDWEVPVARLMGDMLKEVQKQGTEGSESSYRSLGEESLRSRGDIRLPDSVLSTQDFLVTPEYLSLVFLTVFLPFISTVSPGPTTPLIRRQDLDDARHRETSMRTSDPRTDEFLRLISSQGDAYTLVMNSIVAAAKLRTDPVPPIEPRSRNKAAERIRKYRAASQSHPHILMGQRPVRSFLHDWTTLQFHTPSVTRGRLEHRHDSLPPSKPASKLVRSRRKIATERQLPLIPQPQKSTRSRYLREQATPSRMSQPPPQLPYIDTPLPVIQGSQRKRRRVRQHRGDTNRSIQIERQMDVSVSPSPPRALNLSVLEPDTEL